MKSFYVYLGMMIIMLGIWVEVSTAQSDWMPDANLRTAVLSDLKASGILGQAATTFTKANIANPGYTEVDLGEQNITDLTGLEYATSATLLSLYRNKISNISALSGLTSLTKLTLYENKISNISALSGLINLTRVELEHNNISKIPDLSKLTKLTRLQLHENKISDISGVSGLTSLTTLFLRDNQISDISALSGLTSLIWVTLSNNKISNISALSGLTSLTRLYLADNKISNLDALVKLTDLTDLWLQRNRITDINEFKKLSPLTQLYGTISDFRLGSGKITSSAVLTNDNTLRTFLWTRPDSINSDQAVTFGNQPESPPETFPFTIRFTEPVLGFQMEDIIIETDLHTGTGTATLAALTPTLPPDRFAQTYTVTILLPANAAGALRVIVRAGAAETDAGRIDPAVDRVFPWIAFSTLPATPRKRRIIQECPVGWVRSDGFAGRNRRVLIYEVKLQMDMQDRVSIYKPVWVAIYVHPDEGLENLDGWKLQVALPYNHHRDYLLTAENSVVVDAGFVEGGFAFIENPKKASFPMTGMGFPGSPAPGFDYRLYDETGRKVDFGISCYKRFDVFQVLKEMEDPRVLRNVLLESLDWDASTYIRSEWTVPVPVPAAPSLLKKTVVGTWADLKKQ